MSQRDEEDLTKKIEELEKAKEEYWNTSKEIVETLKGLKKSQKEYINLIKEHQEYWRNELEKTGYHNTPRHEKLQKTLVNEEKILKKLEKALIHTEGRIEFHKKNMQFHTEQ